MLALAVFIYTVGFLGFSSEIFFGGPVFRIVLWLSLWVLAAMLGFSQFFKQTKLPPTYREPNPPVYSRLR